MRTPGVIAIRVLFAVSTPVLALLILLKLQAWAPGRDAIRISEAAFVASEDTVPRSDDGAIRPVNLPHDWRGQEQVVEGWYYFQLELAVAPNRLWALWMPRVGMNASVFVNGELVGRDGSIEATLTRNWNRPLYFLIPNGALRPGPNGLAIQVVADRPGAGMLGEVFLAPSSTLMSYQRASNLLRVNALQAITAMMALTSGLMFLLWRLRRKDTVFGWFAVMLAIWTLHNLYLLPADAPWPHLVLDWFWYSSLILLVFTINLVVSRYLGKHDRGLEHRMLVWSLLASLVLALGAWYSEALFYRYLVPISGTVALLISARPLCQMVMRFADDFGLASAAMCAAGTSALLFGIYDWLVMIEVLDRRYGYLFVYASPGIVLMLSVTLTRRFGFALSELELINAELEQRVQARENEIAMSYVKLRELERFRAVAGERERIMRDMHDGIGGTLVSTLAMVENGKINAELLSAALRSAIEDMRLMIDSLDPVDGDLTNVLAMLRSRMESRLNAAGLRLIWAVEDLPIVQSIGAPEVLQIMRILQEAINNIVKHSRARTIRIATGSSQHDSTRARISSVEELQRPISVIWIELRDDGCGFEPALVRSGRGLRNMRHRAQAIGARIEWFAAEPGSGLRLILQR